MSVSFALMCHPSRERFVSDLVERLPEAEVVWDRENSRWETGRRSLLAFDPAADWHCVVQDDAVLCRDFATGVGRVAKAAGETPVSLYTGKVRPHQHTVTPAVRRALREGIPWIALSGPLWGVGLVIPTAHIPELVAWGDEHPGIKNYDRRIEAWYVQRDILCRYTVPSLVDHRPVDTNPSLIEGRTGNRTAHHFIGDSSPLDIDWSVPPISPFAVFRKGGRLRKVPVNGTVHRRLQRHPDWEEIPA